jgi:phage repressor protein C with HTH and peptisase S24 domain
VTGKSAQDDVIKILEEVGQPLATGALVDELSGAYAESTVRNAVSKLNGEGRVEKVGHGVYRLSSGTDETVEIPLVSIRANAGEGEEPFEEQVDGYVVFDREAIQRETNADPSNLAMIGVTGDSMVPTLTPGDRMLVVRHQKGEPLVSGGIYILRSSLRGIIVKRLRWTDDETIILESDNENGPTIEVDMSDDNGHNWEVLGRVVRVQKHL